MPLRNVVRLFWRKSWELQDEQIESGLARHGPVGTFIGRDEGYRVAQKLRAVGDHQAAVTSRYCPPPSAGAGRLH